MKVIPELEIYMDYCGDEVCDCSWPVVSLRYPYHHPGPMGLVEVIARGPFISSGYGSPEPGEVEAQKLWLDEAREWYGDKAGREKGRE